jgi:hypothetical protein
MTTGASVKKFPENPFEIQRIFFDKKLPQIFYPATRHFGEFLQIQLHVDICFLPDNIKFISNTEKIFQHFYFYPDWIKI